MYYTYVLQSVKDGNFYAGFTGDLKLRFEQHNKGMVEVHYKSETSQTHLLRGLYG